MPGQAGHRLRPQSHQHRVEPGCAGAKSDQGVHVGVVVAELPRRATEKMATAVDQCRQAQQTRRDPERLPDGMVQGRQASSHLGEHQRCGQGAGNSGIAQQASIVGLLGSIALGQGAVIAYYGSVIAGGAHRCNQGIGGHRAADLGAAIGEIDLGGDDAGHAAQGVFHGGDAAGAAHAADAQMLAGRGSGGHGHQGVSS